MSKFLKAKKATTPPRMYHSCSHTQASWGFADYVRGPGPHSPWMAVQGWHIKSCFHDPMHLVFLGTCRDLYASSLGFWIRNDFFGSGTLADRLAEFSMKMRTECRKEKILESDCFRFHCVTQDERSSTFLRHPLMLCKQNISVGSFSWGYLNILVGGFYMDKIW